MRRGSTGGRGPTTGHNPGGGRLGMGDGPKGSKLNVGRKGPSGSGTRTAGRPRFGTLQNR